ncbi:MAG: hypothetical protein P4M01_14070 [Acidobacteriota bacterium]|nr:hypothetical protein [Acidobacteriota bacterium]
MLPPRWHNFPGLLLLTLAAVAVAGYHPAAEDGGVYTAAIQYRLNPALFPWDSAFLTVKLQASLFDRLMAATVRLTHLPLTWLLLGLHLLTIFGFLAACFRLASLCFREARARWASVALLSVLLTLPVSGSGLYLVDQCLVPRTIAAVLALFAASAVLQRRWLAALILLAAALLFQPVLAAMGVSFCVFLALPQRPLPAALAAVLLPWEMLRPGNTPAALHQAIAFHHYCNLMRWTWYEWLGVLAPIALLALFSQWPEPECATSRARLARRTAAFAVFQTLVAVAIMLPTSFERLRPAEPMRYLYFVYAALILLTGGLLGKYVLRQSVWRWAALFVPLALGMFFVQRVLYPSSPHLELPGVHSHNAWVEAFDWARRSTPQDAYFVIGAGYQERLGEDHQVFRALAQRSVLADLGKDSGMVLTSAPLAARWQQEVQAQQSILWPHADASGLHRLRQQFHVTWAVLENPPAAGLVCPYRNERVAVCRID